FLAAAGLQVANAADYPNRDIHFIVPYSPGGGYDTLARTLAPFLAKHLPGNVNVIIENRTGAAAQVGTAYLQRSAPDGYTIGISNIPGLMAAEVLQETPPYRLADFTWLGRVTVVENG